MDWIDEWGKVIDDAQVSDLNPWVEGAVCPWENTGRKSGFTATFPDSSVGKESICNAGDLRSIPGLGRSPGEGKGYSLQYSGLENSMDYIVRGVAKRRTRLSNFHFMSSV